MTTNYHTPIDGTKYYNKASDIESPLAELDSAITDLQTQPYDIPVMYNGTPADALVILRIEMVRAVTFPAGLTLSRLKALVAATGSSVFSLKKNGTEFATLTFGAAGTTATIVAASETTFSSGDILTLVAPVTADATLADLYGMLVGTR